MITFNRFEYSKELFEQYKSSLDLDEDAIVLIDSGTDKYIYAKGSYFGSTEIYKGNTEPTDESIKLWIDTDEQSIKYKDNTNTWVTISSGEGNLIYIGDKKPSDDTEYKVWINPDEVIEDDEEPLIIDTELNPDSINPVQNSTITAEINKLKNNKQDVLVSGENIKTIDNDPILGKGNIDLESKYLKKTDSEAFITEDEVAEQYQPKGDYLTSTDLPDFTLTYIGEEEPEITSDFNRWINPNEDSFDGVDVYNALIEYVNTKFKAIDELLELIIGEEI